MLFVEPTWEHFGHAGCMIHDCGFGRKGFGRHGCDNISALELDHIYPSIYYAVMKLASSSHVFFFLSSCLERCFHRRLWRCFFFPPWPWVSGLKKTPPYIYINIYILFPILISNILTYRLQTKRRQRRQWLRIQMHLPTVRIQMHLPTATTQQLKRRRPREMLPRWLRKLQQRQRRHFLRSPMLRQRRRLQTKLWQRRLPRQGILGLYWLIYIYILIYILTLTLGR